MDSLTSSFTPLCAPNLRPAGTSFQRKEGSIHSKRPTFSPLPLEGAAWRSETGLAPSVCWKCVSPYRYPHHFRTSPFIKINAERRSGAFVSSDLCKNVFPFASSFTPLCTPNLRPAGTSFQRKEGSIHSKRPTFSPLPLEGAVERSETGLASLYVGNAFPSYRYPHHFRTSPYIFAAKPPPSLLIRAELPSRVKGRPPTG